MSEAYRTWQRENSILRKQEELAANLLSKCLLQEALLQQVENLSLIAICRT
jgi:hypothetical protein